jgi:uncharacterized protein (TIGR02996 family)
MNAADSLLAAIRAEPADDIARLAYADLLDEAGDADRAEFIRVQVALARTPDEDPARDELAARERELLCLHGEQWKAALPRLPNVSWGEFTRGFIRAAEVHELVEEDLDDQPGLSLPDDGRIHAVVSRKALAAAFAAAPIDRLVLSLCHGTSLRHIAEALDLTPVKHLHLSGGFDAGELLAWLASPQASHLETLDLMIHRLSEAELRQLLASPHLGRVRSLDLSQCETGADLAGVMAAAPGLANLEALTIGWCGHDEGERIGDTGLRAIASSPHLTRLRRLKLNKCRLTPAGVAALAASKNFANLTRLELYDERLGTEGAAALAGTPHLGRLTDLRLGVCDLSAAGLRALANSPHLAAVRSIDIGGNHLGDEAAAILAARWRLTNLEMIGVQITAAGAAELAGSAVLAGLLALNLSGNGGLGGEGVAALCAAPRWAGLRRLVLNSCGLTAAALEALAASPGLPRLHDLDIEFNKFRDAGTAALARWPGLASVRVLELSYCDVGDAGARALASSRHLRPEARLVLFGNDDIARRTIARLRKKHGAGVWWSDDLPDDS